MDKSVSTSVAGSIEAGTNDSHAPMSEQTRTASETAAGSVSRKLTWKDFIYIMKPGILFDNMITTFGGFWLASRGDINWLLLLYTMLGTTLVVAAGCVLNNYLDRDLDAKMDRTRRRALPSGRMSPRFVATYGTILGIAGLSLLTFLANPLAATMGLIGLFVYVWIYTYWLKRTSVWNTVIGAISGSMPPVIGYVAVVNTLDMGAWILFAILFLWQPPHFWALAIRRKKEYRDAGFQMLPSVRGNYQTKISMVRYVVPLVPASLLLYLYGYVGEIYLYVATALGLFWAVMCVMGFMAKTEEEEDRWAKRFFIFSINYLTILFLVMIIDTVKLS